MKYENDGVEVFGGMIPLGIVGRVAARLDEISAGYDVLSDEQKNAIVLLTDLKPAQFDSQQLGKIPRLPYIIGELPLFGADFLELLRMPALWKTAGELLGTDQITYHFSNATIKPPHYGPRLAWHRDFNNRYIRPATPRFLRALIAIDDMDSCNGCTQVVEGSHLVSDEEARTAGSQPSTESRIIDIECKRGDVVLMHPKALHGGRPNLSDRQRRLIVVQFGVEGEELEVGEREGESMKYEV